MCPYCRKNAPLVYRGWRAHCSACGRPRTVLSGASLTHAGKPARLAGAVVHAFGWVMLACGVGFAALVGLVVGLIFGGVPGLVVGGVLSAIALALFLLARAGGKRLESTGEEEQERRREQALFALAANRGGRLQAFEAANALDISVTEADDLLTKLAKLRPDDVDVEIGDQGEVFYAFTRALPATPGGSYGAAWGAYAPSPRVRIDAPSPRPPEPRRVIDAEIEVLQEEEAAAAERRARR